MTTISKFDVETIAEILDSRLDFPGVYGYINRETGEIELGVDGEHRPDIIPDEEDENYDELMDEFERCWVEIPKQGSQSAYHDMQKFIKDLEDEHLQDLLWVAIQGKGSFGRFRFVLSQPEYSEQLQQWNLFSSQCQYERAIEWLTKESFIVELEVA